MSKPAMPGHLIAVLVVLGVNAFMVPSMFFVPVMLLSVLLSAPFLGIAVLSLGSMAVWGWFAWLVFGLATRQARALRHSRITAAVLCGIGAVWLAGGVLSPFGPYGQFGWATMFDGDLVVLLACGLYVSWALGRADVRAWLTGAVAPQ